MSAIDFQARDRYLGQFPQNRRSTVANRFLDAVRAGHNRPEGIVIAVRFKVAQDIGHTRETLERWPDGDWAEDNRQRLDFFRQLMASLPSPDALAYAQYCLDYEALPQSEKDRMKTRQRDTHIQAHMAGLEPTEAQLGLLRKLGWAGQPTVDSRAEASSLIEAYLSRQGRRA